jgi:hypothetical protein
MITEGFWLKHWQIFSLNKNDIWYCNTMILHKLFMKTEKPIYVKQFKISQGPSTLPARASSVMVEIEDYSAFSK